MNRCQLIEDLGVSAQHVLQNATGNEDAYLQFRVPESVGADGAGTEANRFRQESKEHPVERTTRKPSPQLNKAVNPVEVPADFSTPTKENESARGFDNRSPVSVASLLDDDVGANLPTAFEAIGICRPVMQRSLSWSAREQSDDIFDESAICLKPKSAKEVLAGGARRSANNELSKSEHALSNKVTELSNKGRLLYKKTQCTLERVTGKFMFPSRSNNQTQMQMLESCASFGEDVSSFGFDSDESSMSSFCGIEGEGERIPQLIADSKASDTSNQSGDFSIGYQMERPAFERSCSSLQMSKSLSLSDLLVKSNEKRSKRDALPATHQIGANAAWSAQKTPKQELSGSEHVPRRSHIGSRRQSSASSRRRNSAKDTRRNSNQTHRTSTDNKDRESRGSDSRRRKVRSSKKKDELSRSEHGLVKPKRVEDKLHASFSAGLSIEQLGPPTQEQPSEMHVLNPHFSYDLNQLMLMEMLLNEGADQPDRDMINTKNQMFKKAFCSVAKRVLGDKKNARQDNELSCANLALTEDSMSYQEEFDLLASIRELEGMNNCSNAKHGHDIALSRSNSRSVAKLTAERSNATAFDLAGKAKRIDNRSKATGEKSQEGASQLRGTRVVNETSIGRPPSSAGAAEFNLDASLRDFEDAKQRRALKKSLEDRDVGTGSKPASSACLHSQDQRTSPDRTSRGTYFQRSKSQSDLMRASPHSQETRRSSRRSSGPGNRKSSASRERRQRPKSRERSIARAKSLRDLRSPEKPSSSREFRHPRRSVSGPKGNASRHKEGTSQEKQKMHRGESKHGPEEGKTSSWRDLYSKAPGASNPCSSSRPSGSQSSRKKATYSSRKAGNRRQTSADEPASLRSLLQRSQSAQRHLEVLKFPINKTSSGPISEENRLSSTLPSSNGVPGRRRTAVTPGGRNLELRQW